ncbi:MAG: peptidoglycan DD-metalloendopeptidase family protein [Bacteroidetes bacterium]|nr:peptidoglycan DD-metalloendopeptidase family protein [Bacteroidota bacterium]
MKHIILNILMLLFSFVMLSAQYNEKIQARNTELTSLRDNITRLEKELNEAKKEQKESVKTLSKINNQSLLINKKVLVLQSEEKNAERAIKKLLREISEINASITELKSEYGKYIIWLYKYGKTSKWKILFSSQSLNQALIRYKYLNYITDKNDKMLTNLKSVKAELSNKKNELASVKKYKRELIEEKTDESKKLDIRKKEKSDLVGKLIKDQKSLLAELEDKRKAEIRIKEIIERLDREERDRLRKIREDKLKGIKVAADAYNYERFESFNELKGKLTWPVKSGNVVRGFGENRNTKLNTVTLNYGIDINTSKAESVHSVAEGVVSAIDWIPGYGSVIIVTHKGAFRTVYGHVVDILVKEGDHITSGNKIGTVNESLEGNILHFEIWNERLYQNPSQWLVRKN